MTTAVLGAFLILAPSAAFARWHQAWPEDGPPPAPREEIVVRPGYVYSHGYHRWHRGHYVWTRGHYVRERPGWSWRDGAWESRDGHWEWRRGGWYR